MPTEKQVVEALREVVDPHSQINVYDMGLISELKVTRDSVSLTFRPTSQFCPLGVHLSTNIKRRLLGIPKTKKATVKVVGHVKAEMINAVLAEQ
ncbi:MAG: iron-sulfur cluster assembly protein [Candidatus Thermoplasmatota archaeon]